MRNLFKPKRPKTRWVTTYSDGDRTAWDTDLHIDEAFKHVPKIGDKHGSRTVIAVDYRPLH